MCRALAMEAAGAYRRTSAERNDQELSWKRPDRAFFAAGACHVLAWVCRETYPGRPLGIAAIGYAGDHQVIHAFATWNEWAFDHSGWHPGRALLQVNERFEGRPLECIVITSSLDTFCAEHRHRMPEQFWADPLPRARGYVRRFVPPWSSSASGGVAAQ